MARPQNPPQYWQESEESFLKLSSEITSEVWGKTVIWRDGPDWPKLNFVRLCLSDLSGQEFIDHTHLFREYFHRCQKTFSIKIPESVDISDSLRVLLRPAGTPIVFYKIEGTETVSHSEFMVCAVRDLEELKSWWRLFSDFGPGEEKFSSPYWPITRNAFDNGTRFYLLQTKTKESIACMAIDYFEAGGQQWPNVWGVATREDFQRRGCFKSMMAQVLGDQAFFLQTNFDSRLDHYYRHQSRAQVLEIERRYLLKEEI